VTVTCSAIGLGLVLVAALSAPTVQAGADPQLPWTREQGMRIARRLAEREPFLSSREALNHADSLNRFFGPEDYKTLRGNPVYGYWDDGRFRWSGVRVAWGGIAPVARSARAITPRAWTAAFKFVAKQRGLVIDKNAPIRIEGACIGAVLDPSPDEPNRGVVLEMRFEMGKDRFLYRFGMGKPTLEDAVGASLDWAVGLAMQANKLQDGSKGRR
jgi:hypothetical protein